MPAQVSGPGALSKRTDTGGQPIRDLPNPKYGEAKAFEQQQKSAPLAQAEGVDATPAPSRLAAMGGVGAPNTGVGPEPTFEPPMDIDSEADPSIPVTAGAPMGAGPNEITGLPGGGEDFNPKALREALMPWAASDTSGVLDNIIGQLSERGLW